jgi:hypothetical protein
MDAWLSGMYEIFLHFFGRATPVETGAVIAFCLLLGALALSRIGNALGAAGAFYSTGIVLTAAGLALVGCAMALPPVFDLDACWMPLAAAIAVFLVVVLPLTVLFQKGGYIAALIAWTVTLLVITVVLTLEPMVMRTFEKGVEKGLRLEKHRVELEMFK